MFGLLSECARELFAIIFSLCIKYICLIDSINYLLFVSIRVATLKEITAKKFNENEIVMRSISLDSVPLEKCIHCTQLEIDTWNEIIIAAVI